MVLMFIPSKARNLPPEKEGEEVTDRENSGYLGGLCKKTIIRPTTTKVQWRAPGGKILLQKVGPRAKVPY